MRLRRNQLCPIHHSHFCCGREAIPREKPTRQMGVRRIEDPHHPRGYRELRSNGEMRKLLNRKIVAQNGICTLCSRITKLESSRLVKEDTLCKESMTRAERAWLREHRSKSAEHWNLLTDLTVEQLDHVVL